MPTLIPIPDCAGRWSKVLDKLVGQVVNLVLYAPRKRRTLAQNRYLWAGVYRDVLDGMRRHCFEHGVECPFQDEDDIHIWAKHRFLRAEHVLPGGELLELCPSTTLLDTQQFSAYVERICAWAAEPPRGIYVHTPEDYWR
jgi:hypothetical protein